MSQSTLPFLVLLSFSQFHVFVSAQSMIHSPEEFAGDFKVQSMRVRDVPLIATSNVIFCTPDCCKPNNTDQFAGNIIAASGGQCSIEDKINIIMTAGGIGYISLITKPGVPGIGCLRTETIVKETTIPLVCGLVTAEIMDYLMAGLPLNATIVMAENDFSSRFGEYYALIVMGMIPCIVIVGLALYKLILFIEEKKFSIAILCLLMILAGNLLRIVYWADPSGILFFKGQTKTVFLSVHFPFFIASCLLIGFYWQEVLHAKSLSAVRKTLLSKLLPPALVTIGILILFEIISVSLRVSYLSNTILYYLTTAFYIIFSIIMGILLLVGGAKLQRTLAAAGTMLGAPEKSNIKVKRMTGLLILAAVSMIGLPIGIAVTVSWTNLWNLYPVHLFISSASLFICLIFQPKNALASRDSSKVSKGSSDSAGTSADITLSNLSSQDTAEVKVELEV